MVYGWIWIAVIVIAVIVEAVTEQMVSIWFVPAAIIATILDFVDVPIIWQVVVFLVVSIIGIILAKKFLFTFKRTEDHKTNIETIIGDKCVVTEKIDNYAGCGQAKVRGQVWSARSVNDEETFEEGELLKIVAIEGVKLICKK